jgi:uncharacterized protein YbjT (DUF2867 family)
MDQVILVVGATGMLGEPVARQLHADGYQVRLLARDPARMRTRFGAGYEVVPGDVEKPETLEAALAGCHGVHVNLSGGPRPADYDRIEHQGTANVARAAARFGVGRLTYISAASVRPERGWFYYTRAKLGAEEAIRTSGLSYTIFRASWFMESLPWFVKGKRAFLIGRQRAPLHWVAAGDYARMVSQAYRTPEAANKVSYVYGPEVLPMLDALRLYCSIVCPGTKVYTTPTWLVGLTGLLTGNAKVRDGARMMAYYKGVTEEDDPTEANVLLGAPTTTLRQWCERRARTAVPA